MSGLRIALAHSHPFSEVRRGGERYVADLASYLGNAGHQVDVVTGTRGPSSTTREGNVTWKACHRSPRRGRQWDEEDTIAAPVLRHLALERYDVVHAFTPQTTLAARLSGHRVVFTVLGAPSRQWLAAQPGPRLELFVAAAWGATALTALSEAAARNRG